MSTPTEAAIPKDTFSRFRRWAAVAVAVAVLGYLAYAVLVGFRQTGEQLLRFDWRIYVAVLGLTLFNYALRYAKWTFLLDRLGIRLPSTANRWVFGAGLAMVISPGKAGELLKPYLVREVTGASLVDTVPALVAERGTDGIAVVALAALGVSTYGKDQLGKLLVAVAIIAVGMVVVIVKPLAIALIEAFKALPVVGRFGGRLEASYLAMRTVASPGAFLVAMAISLVAWGAECLGYWLVFKGLGVQGMPLGGATFLYAFATVFGGASPGGLGMADAALVQGAQAIVPGLGGGPALAAALLQRLATLWLGVGIGGVALLNIDRVLEAHKRPGT